MIERIPIGDRLPDSFFALPATVYQPLPFAPEEDRDKIQRLLSEEGSRHDMVLYTNHRSVRLLGIFPPAGDAAYFAYWEANDPKTNRQAFEHLEQEAIRRKKPRIQGPLTFNTFHRYRLRLQNPSWSMFDQEPVNPIAYVDWLEELGYTAGLTFESRRMQASDMPHLYESKEHYLATLTDLPFRYVPLTPATWDARTHEIFELIEAIFSQNPGYRPISYAQFGLLYNNSFAQKLCPHSSVLLEERSSRKLIGMSFCLPNYRPLNTVNPSFVRDYPRLTYKTLLIKSVGIHPNFRRQGLMTYLGAYCMQTFQDNYQDAIFCLMRANNPSLSFTDNLPFERCTYALFEKIVSS